MSLKVFDMQCDSHHQFEAWFRSSNDYESQKERGLVACPICQSTRVLKQLSAPRLNVTHIRTERAEPKAPLSEVEMLKKMRALILSAENVGDKFATEARRIHDGQALLRPIKGKATIKEQQALFEDGISILPIPTMLDDDKLH